MVRIQDVARHANVSVSTVSRVLNDDPMFSTTGETRARILKAVEELGYRPLRKRKPAMPAVPSETGERQPRSEPYRVGSQGRGGEAGSLKEPEDRPYACTSRNGVAISDPVAGRRFGYVLAISIDDERRDPYFASIRFGIEQRSAEFGLEMARMLRLTDGFDPSALDGLDGVVVVGSADIGSFGGRLFDGRVVMINNLIVPDPHFDVVTADLALATVNAIDTLHGLGHRRIGFVGGSDGFLKASGGYATQPDVRSVAYENRMRALGLFDERLLRIGGWSGLEGERMTAELLSESPPPTAIVAASDPMAVGVLQAIRDAGLSVPGAVSVISFDDIEAAAFLNPPLSTVRVHAEEIGRQAVNLLIERFRGRKVPIRSTVLTQLVVRGSFGPAPKGEAGSRGTGTET